MANIMQVSSCNQNVQNVLAMRAGVANIMRVMDWGDAEEFVSFGEVNKEEVDGPAQACPVPVHVLASARLRWHAPSPCLPLHACAGMCTPVLSLCLPLHACVGMGTLVFSASGLQWFRYSLPSGTHWQSTQYGWKSDFFCVKTETIDEEQFARHWRSHGVVITACLQRREFIRNKKL